MATRNKLFVVVILMLAVGAFGTVGVTAMAIPSWLAAHGHGHLGVFTLTEPMSCDRNPPPKQRCGWFGDFISDDRAVVKHHVELAGGLPPGAKTGDSVRARSAGSHNTVFRDGDTTSWQTDAMFLGLFSGALLLGITLTIVLNRLSRRDGAAGGPPCP